MGKKIYVGNLSFSTTEQTLSELFGRFGSVESAKVISDRDTGRSKGFAFVEMSSDEEAANAIRELHETSCDGRNINVSEAKPMAPRGDRGGFGGGGGGRGGRFGGNGGGRRDRY